MNSQMGVLSPTVALADLSSFSFRTSPVQVIENFWSAEERQFFCEGMNHAAWRSLSDLPNVRENFPNPGNWAEAEIGPVQGQRLLSRLQLPCIQEYMELILSISGRPLGFSYYSHILPVTTC